MILYFHYQSHMRKSMKTRSQLFPPPHSSIHYSLLAVCSVTVPNTFNLASGFTYWQSRSLQNNLKLAYSALVYNANCFANQML